MIVKGVTVDAIKDQIIAPSLSSYVATGMARNDRKATRLNTDFLGRITKGARK